MEIRRAREDEIPAILALASRIFHGEQGIPLELMPLGPELRPVWWCAVENGEVVGTLGAYVENGRQHMARLVIREDCRGRGLAGALIRFGMAELFASGVERIYTESRPVTAQILFKLGGHVSGESFPFYGGICIPVDILREDYLAAITAGTARPE